jgi:hypothetical protein
MNSLKASSKRNSLVSFILVVLLFCNTNHVFGQSQIPKKYPNTSKVKVLLDFPKEGRTGKTGKGYSASLSQLPNGVKKVALASFFVFDPGITKTWSNTSSSGGMSYTTSYTKKRNTGGLSADICIGALDKAQIPMKESFKKFGIELLMPDEYLDTDEKETFYNNFETKHDKLDNFFAKLGSKNHDVMFGAPDGITVVDIVKEPYSNYSMDGLFARKKTTVADNQIYVYCHDLKMMESIGYDLCSALEVDAVIVSYATVWAKDKNTIQLENVRMAMFGPNPVMPKNGESTYGLIPHIKGLFYVATSVNPQVYLYDFKKSKPETANFDFTGWNFIYEAMSNTMGKYIQKQTGK